MKRYIFIVMILMVMLCGCGAKQEECKVKVDNIEVFISGKIGNFDIKDLVSQEDDSGYCYNKDGLYIYTNSAQVIEKIEILKADYELSNGDVVGMDIDDFKEGKEFVTQSEILDNDNNLVEGKYGVVYDLQNVKVEYVFKNNVLNSITISQIFDF